MSRSIFAQVFYFFVYVAAQVFIVRNFAIYGFAFCYIYVGFILLLPFEISAIWLLLVSFITGLAVDVFYDTLGIHAAASVLLGFLRPPMIRILTPRSDLEEGLTLSMKAMGLQWFLSYSVLLVLAHHLALFLLEAGNPALFGLAAMRAGASTVFTVLVLLILQSFGKSKR